MTQPTLFDMDAAPVSGGHYDCQQTDKPKARNTVRKEVPVESKDAGLRNRNAVHDATKPRHGGDRDRVLERLRHLGLMGATRDELSISMVMPLTTVCGRVRELLDVYMIIETDIRRETRTGSTAVVLQYQGDTQ